MSLSVILPAHDEAGYLAACLSALLRSDGVAGQIVVVANGCRDDTATVARRFAQEAARRGWTLNVIETPEGGKLNAMNLGDGAATWDLRLYLDADVIVSPPLLAQIVEALGQPAPRYATGSPRVSRAQSPVTRAYARFWSGLPFVTHGAPGFGLYAVNAAGRARWGAFPDIISDDTFVRLQFAPEERLRLPATYDWPMVEGFANLVRVRRRQNIGVEEIARHHPDLLANDDARHLGAGGVLRRLFRDPVAFAVYAAITLAVKSPLFANAGRWVRGR
ncbi:glycosyltransferase family 2 protein [Oceaniglobus trochenteri]|uniref:glycosyltransferase family 2 protein n=1 Tax=Oceaniglobus trochenteri TaxID=2763260 RepID=UPI001CFFE22C|nr:glycosyltransferase [Oceaniglobus trochenteri]